MLTGLMKKKLALDGQQNLQETKSQIVASVSSKIAAEIIRRIEGDILMPMTSYGVGQGVGAASKHIQNAIIRNSKTWNDEKDKQLEEKRLCSSQKLFATICSKVMHVQLFRPCLPAW